MMLSSTALASDAPGPVLVGLLSGLAGVALSVLTLRHHRQVLAWTRRLRATDDIGRDLDEPATHLGRLSERLNERGHRPCREDDIEPLIQLRDLLDDAANDTEPIRAELRAVVDHLDRYLRTVLPPAGVAPRVPATEHTAQLTTALKQGQARTELKSAVSTARRRIRELRRTS